MRINSKDFRVREGHKVDLKKWPTKVDPAYKSKEQYKKLLEDHVEQLSSQQSFTTHQTARDKYPSLVMVCRPRR